MRKYYKIFIISLLLLFSLVGCRFGKKTIKIAVDFDTIPEVNIAGKVDLSNMKVRVYYSVDKYYSIKFNENMFLDETEADKLNLVGEQLIYITYDGFNALFPLTIVADTSGTTSTGNTVNIFTMNDTHGAFLTGSDTVGLDKVTSVLKSLEGDYIKLVDGDFFQGSFFSNMLYGLPGIEWLNEMEFDCFVIGNHEFDWGIERIAAYKDGDLSNGEADFPFLACNIFYKGTNTILDWVEPYTIVENNGYRVGVIGCIGENLTSSISLSLVSPYTFADPVPLVERYAKELRTSENCDSVVVAIHEYSESTNYRFASLKGDSRIDAIINGHTHTIESDTLTRSDGYMIPAIECSTKNNVVGTVVLNMAETNGNTHAISASVKNYYPASYSSDIDMFNMLNDYYKPIEEVGREVVGVATGYLSKEKLGKLASNAIKMRVNADVGIVNSGGVRTTFEKGDITFADVYEAFPFDNTLYVVEMTGKQVKDFCSNSSLYLDSLYDASKFKDSNTYKVAVISYVYENYGMVNCSSNPVDTFEVIRDVIVEYLRANK